MTPAAARVGHGVVAVVTIVTLVVQTVMVVMGSAVLEDVVPPLGRRLFLLVCYFTIQSNLAVAIASVLLARDPARDGRWFRALRLASVIGITVTGVVHLVLLRPLMNLQGLDFVVDLFLHAIVPLLAVIAWLVLGPRPRVDGAAIGLALIWPVLWLVATLIHGALTDWYPYPFLDAGVLGYGPALLNCLGVTVLFLVVAGLLRLVDRHLPPAPTRERTGP